MTITGRYEQAVMDDTAKALHEVRNSVGTSLKLVVSVEVSRCIYSREVRQWNP